MNLRSALVSAFLFFSLTSQALQTSDIYGAWRYVAYKYQGKSQALPHPDLNLTFTFLQNGTEVIRWEYSDNPGFCEGTATYQISNNHLVSQLTATNPKNNVECAEDPDMQIGKKSLVPIEIHNGQLYLNIGLSGEDLFYIFDKTTEGPKPTGPN
jgi:hypothetical protein